MRLIGLKLKTEIDLTTKEGFNWLRENLFNDDVEFVQAEKDYSEDKSLDKFKLIQQGAVITKGQLFEYFNKLIG
jgi:5-bromo-4-chloroindolyl phosphate hydrolysis protein